MGVYIKGLNKKDISDLRVHKYGGAYEYIDYKNIVEVKEPHGRLIDAEALHEEMQKGIEFEAYDKPFDYIAEILDAPTVIEAEVE